MRLLPVFAAAVLLVGSPGCTFVHMAPGASKVKVLAAAPTGCVKRGEVEVSVKDRLGPYERSESQVRDELETLARNEAPGLSADSISSLTRPNDGEQRWAMWHCGS
ncbi:DUF4156 domain-containing protein [Thermomonas sp.]|uniref:DUF4156 domain-containing protein n=1 Tax=Thermomonas sp. TaxID=1971895 RepID=UPI0024891A73|nr:DUF4156 domain-containing protein [Thermomonas sp.]MDI1252420.1 DUF4156 domain-containing protein [Thermomonas sp.]